MTFFHKLTTQNKFHKVVSFVIIMCSIVLGLETVLDDPRYFDLLSWLDAGITIFFILEILSRILGEKTPFHYFILFKPSGEKKGRFRVQFSEHGFWNWFDFLITLGSAIALVEHLFVHPEYLFVTRLFRIFRIFRLLEISQKMREIEKKIANIIPTVFSFALLIFVILYIYSIVGFYIFRGEDMGAANFSNLSQSLITMFRVMTLDGWGDILKATELNATHLPYWVMSFFFVSFIGITAIITLNIFIAVLASNVEAGNRKDRPEAESGNADYQSIISELKAIKQELHELKKK